MAELSFNTTIYRFVAHAIELFEATTVRREHICIARVRLLPKAEIIEGGAFPFSAACSPSSAAISQTEELQRGERAVSFRMAGRWTPPQVMEAPPLRAVPRNCRPLRAQLMEQCLGCIVELAPFQLGLPMHCLPVLRLCPHQVRWRLLILSFICARTAVLMAVFTSRSCTSLHCAHPHTP